MYILMAFSPWIFFWILSAHAHAALPFVGLIISLIINIRSAIRKNIKVIEVAGLLFFLVATVALPFVDSQLLLRWSFISGNLLLLLVAAHSLFVEKPFTLQFAREHMPDEACRSPEVFRSCRVICWFWVIAFLLMTFASARRFPSPDTIWLFNLAIFLAALNFTEWYKFFTYKAQ
jgi:uncharacterized membrane protein